MLELPDFTDETCKLMESDEPSFGAQLVHAAMLLAWRREAGLPPEHPPENPERFTL